MGSPNIYEWSAPLIRNASVTGKEGNLDISPMALVNMTNRSARDVVPSRWHFSSMLDRQAQPDRHTDHETVDGGLAVHEGAAPHARHLTGLRRP